VCGAFAQRKQRKYAGLKHTNEVHATPSLESCYAGKTTFIEADFGTKEGVDGMKVRKN
jgi:hypothetical protein